MKLIDMTKNPLDVNALMELAAEEPVLLIAPDGREFVLSEADDFETEVESLRSSQAFQRFLEERSAASEPRTSLDEIERDIDSELAAQEGRG